MKTALSALLAEEDGNLAVDQLDGLVNGFLLLEVSLSAFIDDLFYFTGDHEFGRFYILDVVNDVFCLLVCERIDLYFLAVDIDRIVYYVFFAVFVSVCSWLGGVFNFHKTGRPAGVIGIGQRFNLLSWLNIKWELRDYIFNDTIESDYGTNSDIQNYFMLNIGVGFFIPPTFSYKIR